MLDYANLITEYDSLFTYSKHSLSTITNLNSLYKSVYKYGEQFYLHTKKANETFFEEQVKADTKSSMSKNLFEFYRSYEDYSIRVKSVLSKDIIDPMGLFNQNLSGILTENLEEVKSIVNVVIDAKKNLEKIKLKYYESCRVVQEHEQLVCKTFSGKIIHNDEEINMAHDMLLKYRSQSENHAQLYKYEITKFNKLLLDCEKRYHIVTEKFRINEESRIFFIKCNMEKFSKLYEEFTVSSFDFLNRLNSTLMEIKMDEDLKLFDEKFNYTTNRVRLQKEEFVPYDTYKRENQIKINSQQVTIEAENTTASPSFSGKSGDMNEEFEIISDSQIYCESYQLKLLDGFLNQLIAEEEIDVSLVGRVMEVLYNNPLFSKTFIDFILKDRKYYFVKFLNLSNLQHFANILNTISLNLDGFDTDNYDLNFAIIFFAERTYYHNTDTEENIFLSALISKNKLYSTKTFWVDLIELKLARRLEEHVKRLEKIDMSRNVSLPKEANQNMNTNVFTNLGFKLKNIFNKDKERNSKDKELFSNGRAGKFIRNFENLSEEKKEFLEKIACNEISNLIKEFIPHFANFNFDTSEAIDMIVELSTKYKLSKEKISYFVTYLNSSVFSVKNLLPRNKKECSNPRNILSTLSTKSQDYKLYITASAIKFLSSPDYLKILTLNRNFNKKLTKKVYKHTLNRKDLTTEERLLLWKSILRTNELKQRVNYKELIKEIDERKLGQCKNIQSIDEIINLDVQRTFFESNIEESRNAIGCILKAIAVVNPRINYCQGMNYIASFLYRLTKDEEETFYIMMGLFEFTDFSLIFLEDLMRLKIFFYVFDRLLCLYLPELYTYFKTHSVIVNYFCSPWFITLFTNTSPYISNENPQVILKIWDEFLLNGWKSLMKTGLCLLKTYESNLIQLKYEDLLHFLINDLIKSSFFQNSNYDSYLKAYSNLKIKNELLNNLENENIQDMKIKEIEEKK